jgi:tellurite resistance protein
MKIMSEMKQEQALNVLIAGIKVAQAKGAFTLEESALLYKAIDVFLPKQTVAPENIDKTQQKDDKKSN